MTEKLTPHVRKKQKISTQTQMSRTKIEQRLRCSARCKGEKGVETEKERGSGKQRSSGLAWRAPLCSVIVSSRLQPSLERVHASWVARESWYSTSPHRKQDRRVGMSFGDVRFIRTIDIVSERFHVMRIPLWLLSFAG
jgi:hypothetical protein